MRTGSLKAAALYARVSSTEQSHNTSLGGQLAACRAYAEKLGYTVVAEEKDDVSGTTFERVGLDRLRAMAAKGELDAVVVYKVDRLARDKYVSAALGMFFEEHRTRLLYVDRDDSTPVGEMTIEFEEMLSRHERRAIVQRTADGRRNKIALEGKVLGGGRVSYGYRWVNAVRVGRRKVSEGYLEILPAEAAVVQRVFQWSVREGRTLYWIGQQLQEAGVPTRSGRPWNLSSIHGILKNPLYAGMWVWNKNKKVAPRPKEGALPTAVIGSRKKTAKQARPETEWLTLELPHLALIDRATFDAAQRQLTANRATAKRNGKRDYLLRGLVICGKCGMRFHGHSRGGHIAYQCGGRVGKYYLGDILRCDNKMIMMHRLDDAVWAAVVKQLVQPDNLQVGQSSADAKKQRERDQAELTDLAVQERKLDHEADQLLRLSTDPEMLAIAQAIGTVKMREKAEAIARSREHIAARRADAQQRATESQEADLSREHLRRAARQLRPLMMQSFTKEQKRHWLERLNVKVTVYADTVLIQGYMTNDVLNLGRLTLETTERSWCVRSVPFGIGTGRRHPQHRLDATRVRVLVSWDDRTNLAGRPAAKPAARSTGTRRARTQLGLLKTACYMRPKPYTGGPPPSFQFLPMW